MQKSRFILIPAILFSFVAKSQTKVTQRIITLERVKDSCFVLTEICKNKDIVFSSLLECKKSQSDSLKFTELKRVKLINQNYNWKNKE
jgi:hypothetical protein